MPRIHHKTLHDPLIIAGLQVRTSNAAESTQSGQIGRLWSRFFSDNVAASIPNRVGDALYAVYSNYESNENGAYDILVGVRVSTIEGLPAGITFAGITTGEYAVLTTEKGPVAERVPAAWREVWSLTPEALGSRRAFLSDYELYDHRAADPANAEVEIHIGLEPRID
ncbi:MAG TPA: GyrI-like domain-containing protein [Acidobacteriaceae bacterium]